MLGCAAALGNGSLWAIAFSSLLAILAVSVHRGWQYLLERQRQRYAERLAEKVPPGVEVEVGAGQSSVHVCNGLAAAATDEQGPPKGPGEPRSVELTLLDAHRQTKLSENVWTPPA